jgi:hypothetical protein
MAKAFTRYRVFVGSPRGLGPERERFHDLLLKVTSLWAEPRGVTFQPVSWEDTVGGRGRPQELINKDLRTCDYAVFVLHDRWGSSTGRFSSGTEEELKLADSLCRRKQMRDMIVFFKEINAAELDSPRGDVRKILDFKRSIERKYLIKDYDTHEMFSYHLEASLAKWLRDHDDIERSILERESIPVASGKKNSRRRVRAKKARRGAR